MTSEHNRKSSFSTGRNRSGSINTPRFAAQAAHRGQLSTAERHTLPVPELISSQNSADELGNNIPGSYPQEDMPWVSQMLEKHHGIDNPKHLGTFKVDLPLEEHPSGARQGVGSLPGPNAECGVAILPDERHPDRLQEDPGDSPLPSKEHPSGSRVGVGSLPGKNFEAGVATLPEERINGRPFGQGHTGFEKTLGNERTHVDIDTPATRTKGQHAPKETIFSATQREMKRDPDFLSHRGAFFQHPHPVNLPSTEGVRTFVQGAAGAVYLGGEGLLHGAQGALQSFEERFKGQDPIQATKDMIQNLEARFGTEDTINRAKEQIHSLEGRIEAGAGGAMQGAKGMIHNLEACFAPAPNPSDMEGPPVDNTSNSVPTPQDSSGETLPTASMFVTTGTDTTDQEMPYSSRSPVPPPSTSMRDSHQVSGVPSTLPQSLQQEYLRSNGREINDDALDIDDDASDDVDKDARAGVPSDSTDEGVAASDDRDVLNIEGGDTARGVKGVQYFTHAQGGMLPGYPTPEGMAMLIDDRLKDDQARYTAAVGDNSSALPEANTTKVGRACLMRDDSATSAEAVRGSYSSEFLPSTADTPDPGIEDRIIEERREIPVFEGGSIHADGKYEAVFRPVSDYPEELIASSALHRAHEHHDLHRPSRSSETKDLSSQFTHPRHLKHLSTSVEDGARNKQVAWPDLPREVDERPDFLNQSGDTAVGKYDTTYHLASVPTVEMPSTDMPAVGKPERTTRSLDPDAERFPDEQLVRTDHPDEIEGRLDFRDQSADTTFGKYEATYHPAGMPSRPFLADDASTAGTQTRTKQADPPSATRLRQFNHQFGNQQVAKTNHPNEIDELPTFVNRADDTAAGKYEATFHLAGMGPDQVPVSNSRRQPAPTQAQGAVTSYANEVQERPIFNGGNETAKGRYEAVYAPVGAPLDTAQKMGIAGTGAVQRGQAGVKKEIPAYLGQPLSGQQPTQEQHIPQKKTLN